MMTATLEQAPHILLITIPMYFVLVYIPIYILINIITGQSKQIFPKAVYVIVTRHNPS